MGSNSMGSKMKQTQEQRLLLQVKMLEVRAKVVVDAHSLSPEQADEVRILLLRAKSDGLLLDTVAVGFVTGHPAPIFGSVVVESEPELIPA